MSQLNFNDGDLLSVARAVINGNANDAESRLTSLETNTVQDSTSAAITHVITDRLIKCDTSSNDISVNLLAASTWTGKTINIKKTAIDNNVTINPDGAELIDGVSTLDFFNFNESITIQSDGTGVVIV